MNISLKEYSLKGVRWMPFSLQLNHVTKNINIRIAANTCLSHEDLFGNCGCRRSFERRSFLLIRNPGCVWKRWPTECINNSRKTLMAELKWKRREWGREELWITQKPCGFVGQLSLPFAIRIVITRVSTANYRRWKLHALWDERDWCRM